jgi:phytoene synthase
VNGARDLLFEGLASLLEGLALDAEGAIPADDDALEAYCRAVGGGPGLAALPVFGRTDARAFALALGVALQRTNVLRDVAADARAGRCYVPLEELERNGMGPADLLSASAPPRYRRLVAPLLVRARSAFAKARSAVPPGAASDLSPALAMGSAYETILARIEADPGRVYRERVRVPLYAGLLRLRPGRAR